MPAFQKTPRVHVLRTPATRQASPSRSTGLLLLGWVAVLVIGAALRLWQLPEQVLFDDELHALHKAMDAGFRDILTHFGRADHSIPLTALYNAVLRWGGSLDEWTMRLPLLLGGLAMIPLIPWLMRPFATPEERLLTGGLLAISPLLIQFSRQARPYTLAVVLAWLAVMAFWFWWQGGGRRWAVAYVAGTALAAWLLSVTLVFTLAPFVYFGVRALWAGVKHRDYAALHRLTKLGVVTVVPLLILLGPPVYFDFPALSHKAGTHQVTPVTIWRALELFRGAANPAVSIAWTGLAVGGAVVLGRRTPALATYLAAVCGIGALIIVASNASWIHYGMIFGRYMLPVQSLLLALVAIGLLTATSPLLPVLRWGVIGLFLAVLYALGPLSAIYHQPVNQFTGHLAYQFDYDMERSLYRQHMPRGPAPAFYRGLAELPPGSVTLVFAPWYFESFWNRLHYHQQTHRQWVLVGMRSGYCADRPPGEYRPGQSGLAMRNQVHLTDVVAPQSDVNADYLVFHLDGPREGAGDLNDWFANRSRLRPLEDTAACLTRLEADLGPPMYADEAMVVFRLRRDAPDVPGFGRD